MKKLRHNVLRERITTALGVVLFVLTTASVFVVQGITWGDAWVPMAISLLLMLLPDKALGIVRRVADRHQEQAGNLLPLWLLGGTLLLTSCGVYELVSVPVPSTQQPAYLTPPPSGATPAQRRRWQRAQRRGMVEASRTVPSKVKGQRGSVALATAPGAVANVTAPATVKGTGSATLSTAPGALATNNAGIGTGAGGGVNTGAGGTAAGPPPVPWYAHLLRGAGVLLLLIGTGWLLIAYGGPWLLARWPRSGAPA